MLNMKEIIIKVFKSKQDFKEIAESIGRVVTAFEGEIKSVLREGSDPTNPLYENQIFQIGVNDPGVEIFVNKKV